MYIPIHLQVSQVQGVNSLWDYLDGEDSKLRLRPRGGIMLSKLDWRKENTIKMGVCFKAALPKDDDKHVVQKEQDKDGGNLAPEDQAEEEDEKDILKYEGKMGLEDVTVVA